MNYTFDTANKWVIVPNSQTEVDMQDVYNDCMDWVDEQPSMSFDIPVSAYGKFQLRTGIYTDIIYVLNTGWKLRFWGGNYQATVSGTAITDNQSPRTSLPSGSNIEVTFEVGTKGVYSEGGNGGGLLPEEHNELFAIRPDIPTVDENAEAVQEILNDDFLDIINRTVVTINQTQQNIFTDAMSAAVSNITRIAGQTQQNIIDQLMQLYNTSRLEALRQQRRT